MTVLPVEGQPGCFYVLGEHEWWYFVDLGSESRPASCECPHRSKGRAWCKHLKVAKAAHELGVTERAEQEIAEWQRQRECSSPVLTAETSDRMSIGCEGAAPTVEANLFPMPTGLVGAAM